MVLATFQQHFGAESALFFIRVPARINLMGVHIEYRGGFINTLTIDRELILAIAPRSDAKIRFVNAEPQYAPFEFSMDDVASPGEHYEWLEYINAIQLEKGRWENYVKSACFYLQNKFDVPLSGINAAVHGKIPPAAGLSSSSALVVGTLEALDYINHLNLTPEQKTLFCGEAEWYVGTRGGAGDHGAIIYGKKGHLTHLQFFPLRVEMIPFPEELAIVACHSLVEAKKSAGARDIFNGRVATYEIAYSLLQKHFPDFKNVPFLRDYNPHQLNIPLSELYQMLQVLPLRMTRAEVYQQLPHERTRFDHIFAAHKEPENGYPVRAVCLYGVGECARSELASSLLKSRNFQELGEIMFISQDGDRVVNNNGKLRPEPFIKDFSDKYLDKLISDLNSENPASQKLATLAYQPGGYDCSTPELDLLVDIAQQTEGVFGAGLTGAGLGGMVLVLLEKQAVSGFLNRIHKSYYEPRRLPFAAEECKSIDGLSILDAEKIMIFNNE
jgi:N-acetylgalactosamine kinase